MAPPPSDSYAMAPAARVVLDPMLLRHITLFQRGLPMVLYDFWETHEPTATHTTPKSTGHADLCHLNWLVIKHGTLALLEKLATSTVYRLGGVVYSAIEANRADMLEWAFAHDAAGEEENNEENKLHDWRSAICSYLGDGDMSVLNVLKIRMPIDARKLSHMAGHIKDPALLQWLENNMPGSVHHQEVMEKAAQAGNMVMVQFLLEHHANTIEFGQSPFGAAYFYRHLDVLRCLLETLPSQVEPFHLKRMLKDGGKDVRAVVQEVGGFEPLARELAVELARKEKHDEILQLYESKLLAEGETICIDDAAASESLNTIKFLMERNLASATTDAMDKAAMAGRWDTVMYLHKNPIAGCTTSVMDAAAEQADLSYVKFFHENRSEGCTTRAMDNAAKQGRLPVVKFLHEMRKEGCTTDAMDLAAGGGHLRVVQFLHANRQEGCTEGAIINAAKGGHTTVLQFLYDHYPSYCDDPKLLHGLLLHGEFDKWMKLRALYPEQAAAVIEPVLLDAGEQLELQTIRFIIQDLGRGDIGHLAMDGASTRNARLRADDAKWLRAVMEITGPQSCRLSAVHNAVVSGNTAGWSDGLKDLRFVISVCCEDGALEFARLHVSEDDYGKWWSWGPKKHAFAKKVLHVFLVDPRVPSWLARMAVEEEPENDTYCRQLPMLSGPNRAVYRGDLRALEVLLDMKVSLPPTRLMKPYLSFKGVLASAVRSGSISMLAWLLERATTTTEWVVEPTLLGEALYYHEFEMAEWLVANCIDGCRQVNWNAIVYMPENVVDFGGIACHAAESGDIPALEQLHASHPDVFLTRDDLAKRAKIYGQTEALAFLEQIGYGFQTPSSQQ